MSYADYLRTQQINRPRIFDRRMALGDASTFIERTKLGASFIQGSTTHVINNHNNPFVPDPPTKKMPIKYGGSGAGGRVQDASSYTMTLGARSIREDINNFSSTKTVQEYCERASPAPSLVVANGRNFDGNRGGDYNPLSNSFGGLNTGYQTPCCIEFKPLGNTQLVVRNPILDRIGVQSREQWNGARGTNYGSQNPITTCTTTLTTANHSVKLIPHGNLNSRPVKTDFRTSVMGLQVSADGRFGRPGKLGGALRTIPYIEKHHGNPNINHPTQLNYTDKKPNKPETYPIPRNA